MGAKKQREDTGSLDPFRIDTYIYAEHYEYFKGATDEKICAAMITEALADQLRDQRLMSHPSQRSIPVVDIGSGPADNIQMYLKGVGHPGGFELCVIDQNPAYTGPKGVAHSNLRKARNLLAGAPSVIHADAFDGKLITHLQTPPHYFSLAFLSHLLYHADTISLRIMLLDVSKNVLTPEGVGILFHLETRQESFQYFRRKYGRRPMASDKAQRSDTPAVEIGNPPEAVEHICNQLNIPCYTCSYINRYYFGPMEQSYWKMFQHPEKYCEITDQTARENLHKLYFIVQRAPLEFAADQREESGLSAFLEEVRNVLESAPSQGKQQGSFLELGETLQLIGSTQASEETWEKLHMVADGMRAVLPELTQRSLVQKWGEESRRPVIPMLPHFKRTGDV